FGAVDVASGIDPAWSPDASRIAFSNDACDYYFPCTGGVAIMNVATRTVTQLAEGAGGREPAWTPAGDAIAFYRPGQNRQLFVLRLDGSPAQPFDPPGILWSANPTWSPDGQRIAFTCRAATGSVDICVMNRSGTGLVRFDRADSYDESPAWSPDGSKIAYTRSDMFATEIAVMSVDGTAVKRLTSGFEPAWSRDGTKLVFARGDGLYTVRADGSDVRQITVGNHRAPAWQP
ncbi:MAG: hypothetical protein ACR2L6_11835, partial [Gemmatimonadaceae bacterium]